MGDKMSEMVERVARAMALERTDGDDIWDHLPEKVRNGYRGEARAAIAAMREPTRPMVRATFHNEAFVTNWQSAIDEALK